MAYLQYFAFHDSAERSDGVCAGQNPVRDADGNGKIELLDVNLMERYKEGDDEAEAEIHFTEADVNADGVEYSVEQPEEALGAEDVSAEFDEVFSAQNETELKTGMEQLIDRYKEMLD